MENNLTPIATVQKQTSQLDFFPPTWESLITAYLIMYDTLPVDEKEIVRQEIINCAKIADRFVNYLKPNK